MSDYFFGSAALQNEMTIIDSIKLEETDVILVIDKIGSNSVMDQEWFPAILLKKCKGTLARLLQILFQSFLTSERLLKS